MGMWWDYFRWQWGRDWAGGVQSALAALFGVLGLLGAWRHWKADQRSAMAMTALLFTLIPLLIFYLNFKYRFSLIQDSQPRGGQGARLLLHLLLRGVGPVGGDGPGDGDGVGAVRAERARERRGPALGASPRPVLLVALVPLFGNHLAASRAGEWMARDFAYDMLQSVDPYGILVTAGDNDTFPLWYAQEVEHIRQDVTVLNLSLANTDWYDRQLERRPLATFDSATRARHLAHALVSQADGPGVEHEHRRRSTRSRRTTSCRTGAPSTSPGSTSSWIRSGSAIPGWSAPT